MFNCRFACVVHAFLRMRSACVRMVRGPEASAPDSCRHRRDPARAASFVCPMSREPPRRFMRSRESVVSLRKCDFPRKHCLRIQISGDRNRFIGEPRSAHESEFHQVFTAHPLPEAGLRPNLIYAISNVRSFPQLVAILARPHVGAVGACLSMVSGGDECAVSGCVHILQRFLARLPGVRINPFPSKLCSSCPRFGIDLWRMPAGAPAAAIGIRRCLACTPS